MIQNSKGLNQNYLVQSIPFFKIVSFEKTTSLKKKTSKENELDTNPDGQRVQRFSSLQLIMIENVYRLCDITVITLNSFFVQTWLYHSLSMVMIARKSFIKISTLF